MNAHFNLVNETDLTALHVIASLAVPKDRCDVVPTGKEPTKLLLRTSRRRVVFTRIKYFTKGHGETSQDPICDAKQFAILNLHC